MEWAVASNDRHVVDISLERERRRVLAYRSKMQDLLDTNRHGLSKLFSTGAIFTRQGARAGRDLLAAHQNLLKVSDLLGQLADLELTAQGLTSRQARMLFEQLEILLQKSRALCSRTHGLLGSLRPRV